MPRACWKSPAPIAPESGNSRLGGIVVQDMKSANLPIPEIGAIALTRGILGAGIGLLAANRVRPSVRRKIGIPLLLIGAVSTIPLVYDVIRRSREN